MAFYSSFGIDVPKALAIKNKSRYLTLTGDHNVKTTANRAGMVYTEKTIPRSLGAYYFEMTVVKRGSECAVGLGIVQAGTSDISKNEMVGWRSHTHGFHADDCKFYDSATQGKEIRMPEFSASDGLVLGCLIDFHNEELRFTASGELGPVVLMGNPVLHEFYPAVALKETDAEVQVNFGDEPFIFDFETYWRTKVLDSVTSALFNTPIVEEDVMSLVIDHLKSRGHLTAALRIAEKMGRETESISILRSSLMLRQKYLEGGPLTLLDEIDTIAVEPNTISYHDPKVRAHFEFIFSVALELLASNQRERAMEITSRYLSFFFEDSALGAYHNSIGMLAMAFNDPNHEYLRESFRLRYKEQTADSIYRAAVESSDARFRTDCLRKAYQHYRLLLHVQSVSDIGPIVDPLSR